MSAMTSQVLKIAYSLKAQTSKHLENKTQFFFQIKNFIHGKK